MEWSLALCRFCAQTVKTSFIEAEPFALPLVHHAVNLVNAWGVRRSHGISSLFRLLRFTPCFAREY
jgi:hypothetical protein